MNVQLAHRVSEGTDVSLSPSSRGGRFGSRGCGPIPPETVPDINCICVSVPLAIIGPLVRGREGWRLGGLLLLVGNE